EVPSLIFIFVIAFILSFGARNYVIQKFVSRRLRAVYKRIHNLNPGKELKRALGYHITDEAIADAEREARASAKQNTTELDQRRAQEKFRAELLANISHEFKPPLFAIQGYIETLQDGLIEENPQMANNFLNKAARNIDRLSYLIHDLDEIAKLESGQISIVPERFDLAVLIKESIDDLEYKAEESHIDLQFPLK